MNKQMQMRRRHKSHSTISLALLQIFLSIVLLWAAGSGQFNLTGKDNVTGQPLPIFATTNIAAGITYITNYVVINPTNQLLFTITPTPTITVKNWNFGTASQPSSPITGDNKSVVAIPSTNSYTAPLPVIITSQHADGTCPNPQTVAILLPVQITLLNGSTPDFDGTVVTVMPSDFPTPGVPATPYGNSAADAGTNLGVATPMGAGRNNNAPDNVYSFVLMAAAKALPGFQYRWERFIQRRSWYVKKTTSGTNSFWDVSWRSSRGISDNDTNDLTDPGDFDDSTPSSIKHEFYAHDSSALGYGFAGDSSMNTNDCIHEEKNFTYKVQISPDGTNWFDAATMPIAQSETIKYIATEGTAATDWAGVPSLTGGNTMTQGTTNTLIITTSKVQAMVGTSLPVTIEATANTH